MKKNLVLFALCFLLVLNGANVEGRRHRRSDWRRNYRLFVFGDSFADNGNRGPTSRRIEITRQWYTPYGISDSAHGNRPTGRFSDGLVQSDYLAKILGQDESPPALRLWPGGDDDDDDRPFAGVNFAVAGSSVYSGSQVAPSLGDQIDQFRELVRTGAVEDEDLEDSVALVAISGMHDYVNITTSSSDDDMAGAARDVTGRIVAGVRRLQRLGVSKVLVDALPPLGCTPWRTWRSRYTGCDSKGNTLSNLHNAALRQKLGGFQDVLLLDLDTIFNTIFEPNSGSALSGQFHRKFTPCCYNSADPIGYCGQVDASGRALYSLCSNPGNFFYWDFFHPTQAGWRAVMQVLEEPIKDFLGI